MGFVWVFPLILAFLSAGQSYTQTTVETSNSCYALCPPGYYKVGACDDSAAPHRCAICDDSTFTAINNSIEKCERCSLCGLNEEQIRPCSISNDVVCDCKKGYYYSEASQPSMRRCIACSCKSCKKHAGPDYKRKCLSCQRMECLETPECKKNCAVPISSYSPTSTATPATTSATSFMISTSTATRATVSNTTSNPAVDPFPDPRQENQMPWLFLIGIMVAFLVLFCLLLLTNKQLRYPGCCPCWSANKDLEPPTEDPKFNEQRSHQGSSPATLTLNISEETPMMTLSQSPSTPEHPAHISPPVPDAEYKAARQGEPTEQWPAIVLYAIIKEVPLRRWKEFLRLLSVADQQLERVELEAGLSLGSMERQYQMLRLWSQRSSASLNDVYSALHYMDLSGCAQLLQESLEKLQWRPELNQGFTACRSHTDHDFNRALQDT